MEYKRSTPLNMYDDAIGVLFVIVKINYEGFLASPEVVLYQQLTAGGNQTR